MILVGLSHYGSRWEIHPMRLPWYDSPTKQLFYYNPLGFGLARLVIDFQQVYTLAQ
jgi:hypothetical protein